MPARPGDDDLLLPVRNGGTLLDIMWNDLLDCITQLNETHKVLMDDLEISHLKGRATSVAWCIAVLTQSPRRIDINEIKDEAMERWEAREREAVPE